MSDIGHQETDKLLNHIESEVHSTYKQAYKETKAKLDDYLRRFKIKDKIKLKQLKNGEITEEYYKYWLKGQILIGKRWEEQVKTLAEDMQNYNNIARSIVDGYMPEVYALNHNYATFLVEQGSHIDTSYTLYNAQTVERLIRDNPRLMPAYTPDSAVAKAIAEGKAIEWNIKNITAAMTQAILQGESIDNMSKRLSRVYEMNAASSVRYARTMTTAAENAGRVAANKRAETIGIDCEKVWLATLDGRTRHSHRQLDGEKRANDAKFSNGCAYPGDPSGPQHEVWNCRCTLLTKVKGIDLSIKDNRNSKLGDMTYEEWQGEKKQAEKEETTHKIETTTQKKYKTLHENANEYFEENGFYEWFNSLSFGEKSSIKAYAGGGSVYLNINRYLRGEISLEKYAEKSLYSIETAEKRIKNIKSALDKFELNDNIQVLRVSDANFYKELNVGSVFKDNAFVSTTTDKSRADSDMVVQMTIDVPKGKGRGAWVTPLAQNKTENEFLLNSGQEYEVYKKEIKNGIVYLKLKIKE